MRAGRHNRGLCRIAETAFLPACIAAAFLLGALNPAAHAQPFAIGHTTLTFVDASRSGRSIPCDIYYPADSPGGGVPVGGPAGLEYPVVSFGHGFQLTTDKYRFVWENLVPDGYIVVLPRTAGELFPNHLEFAKDLAFVIGAMRQEGLDGGSLFFARVAAESALMGHSMGGGASFLAAKELPAVTAVANFTAAETNPSAIDASAFVTAPALVFAGSNDCVTPPSAHQIPMFGALASDCKTYVNITGASHCQFAEYSFLCELGEIGCSPDISRAQQHAVTMQFLGLWLDYYLKGDLQAYVAFMELLSTSADITFDRECDVTGIGVCAEDPAIALGRVSVSPNPFNPSVEIAFELRRGAFVRLAIYDARGARLRTLLKEGLAGGERTIRWDGRNDRGENLPSGVYFYDLAVDAERRTGKLTLLR